MSNFQEYLKWKAGTAPFSKNVLTYKQIDNALRLGGPRGIMGLVDNPYTPSETLSYIASRHDNSEDVLYALAYNPSTPFSFLEELYKQEKYKTTVAANVSLDEKFIETLSQSEDFAILNALASNSSTPEHILNDLFDKGLVLFKNEDIASTSLGNNLLARLARNPKAPLSILEKIYNNVKFILIQRGSLDAAILRLLAGNHSSTPEILKGIKAFLDRNPKIDAELVNLDFSQNPNTPKEILESIYHNIKNEVAEHRNTQINIAINPSTPYHLLKTLAQDRSLYGAVIANPKITAEIIQDMNLELLGSEYLDRLLDSPFVNKEMVTNIIRSSRILPYTSATFIETCSHPLISFENLFHPNIMRHMKDRYLGYHMFILLDPEENKYSAFKEFLKNEYSIDISGMSPEMVIDLLGDNFSIEMNS